MHRTYRNKGNARQTDRTVQTKISFTHLHTLSGLRIGHIHFVYSGGDCCYCHCCCGGNDMITFSFCWQNKLAVQQNMLLPVEQIGLKASNILILYIKLKQTSTNCRFFCVCFLRMWEKRSEQLTEAKYMQIWMRVSPFWLLFSLYWGNMLAVCLKILHKHSFRTNWKSSHEFHVTPT